MIYECAGCKTSLDLGAGMANALAAVIIPKQWYNIAGKVTCAPCVREALEFLRLQKSGQIIDAELAEDQDDDDSEIP